MKKLIEILLLLGILLTVSVIMVATVFAQAYPTGMVSYWKLDEGSGITASDSVGGNHGTINGAIWTTGIVDGALNFDGSGDIVRSNKIRLAHSYTLAAWVYPQGYPQDQTPPYGVIIARQSRQQSNYSLHYSEGGGFLVYHEDTADNDFSADAGDYSLDQWYFVVGTYEESTRELKLYVDGNLVATREDVNPPDPGYDHSDDRVTSIGASDHPIYGITNVLNGLIDEVAIYDRALTPAEIQQHYQNGLNGLGYVALVPATIDIDPDTLNLKSKGKWITGYIELPEGYDVYDIDINTVVLNGEVPAESDPKYGFVKDPASRIGDYDGGIPDCMFKFDRSAVQGILGVGDAVEITVTGEVAGTPFEGSDIIRVK